MFIVVRAPISGQTAFESPWKNSSILLHLAEHDKAVVEMIHC